MVTKFGFGPKKGFESGTQMKHNLCTVGACCIWWVKVSTSTFLSETNEVLSSKSILGLVGPRVPLSPGARGSCPLRVHRTELRQCEGVKCMTGINNPKILMPHVIFTISEPSDWRRGGEVKWGRASDGANAPLPLSHAARLGILSWGALIKVDSDAHVPPTSRTRVFR